MTAAPDVPLHEGAKHCAISATLHRDQNHLSSRLLGDLLVRHESADRGWQAPAHRLSRSTTCATSAGSTTSKLLNHPLVYEQMRDWLSPSP